MKTMRKLLSIILALAMIFTLTATALADDAEETTDSTGSGYTITITNDKTGHTYEAYQIFKGTLYEEKDESGYVTSKILSDIEWGDGVKKTTDVTYDLLTALQKDETVVGTDTSGNGITLKSLFADCKTAADVAEVLSENYTNSTLAKAFAQVASENLSTTVAGTSEQETPAEGVTLFTYKISGLSAGYYLVKDKDNTVTSNGDAYTDIILEVVEDVDVETKVAYPSVEKKVSEDGENWYDYTDANIGDTVHYQLTASVPDTSAYTTYEFIFHDTLSDGLTFDSKKANMVVTVYTSSDNTSGTVISATYTKDENTTTNWTLKTSDITEGETFNVVFEDILSLVNSEGENVEITPGSKIVVTYEASLNEKATIGNSGNTNEVYLEYSNNPNGTGTGTTETNTVVTFTFELDVTKVDGDDNATKLEGAEFVLYYTETTTDDDGNETTVEHYLTATENKDNDGAVVNYTVTGWTTSESEATTLVSADDGTFEIIGLDVGTYYLKETKAPDGYNLMDEAVTVEISAKYELDETSGIEKVSKLTVTVDDGDAKESSDTNLDTVDITVENQSGSTLPSTGGIGTTIFYVVGGILIVGAVVLLITKKRMGKEEK